MALKAMPLIFSSPIWHFFKSNCMSNWPIEALLMLIGFKKVERCPQIARVFIIEHTPSSFFI
jgi:hypothetical protein